MSTHDDQLIAAWADLGGIMATRRDRLEEARRQQEAAAAARESFLADWVRLRSTTIDWIFRKAVASAPDDLQCEIRIVGKGIVLVFRVPGLGDDSGTEGALSYSPTPPGGDIRSVRIVAGTQSQQVFPLEDLDAALILTAVTEFIALVTAAVQAEEA